jgi:elongation factor Ts
MAEITAQMVKDLREKSGAGMMDCKKALGEANGDMQKAMNLLRERGAAIASKRSSRAAKEGLITSFMTPDHRTGTLVELNCESDFVARNEDFQNLAQTLAAHTATVDNPDDLMQTKLSTGEIVADAVQAAIGKIGENMVLSRWTRFRSGEGGVPEGFVFNYVHPPGKIGVLVQLSTTKEDLVNQAEFRELARDLAMHIAASAPVCIERGQLDAALLENERGIYRQQALNEGKPEKIVDKIVEGRLSKFYGEVCLLEQPFAKNPDVKIEQHVKDQAGKLGEVKITRFVRFRLGESPDKTE